MGGHFWTPISPVRGSIFHADSHAGSFTIWGTGSPRREFLHADDCADAVVHLMKTYSEAEHVNVGFGDDIAIYELARMVAEVVGFNGHIECDLSKPDGTPRKLMSNDKIADMGWKPKIALYDGIASTYNWFIANI
jgi:GDP-L-fucose synthase